MRYYHGTDYESGLNIIKHGFVHDETIWNCSDDTQIYLVSEEYDDGPYVEDNTNPDNYPAFRFAIEAGQIAAAHNNQTNDALFVFAFDIPDDDSSINLNKDTSTENQTDCYEINSAHLTTCIRENKIKMTPYIIHGAYVHFLRIFYLKDLSDDYYIPDEELLEILESMKHVEALWFYDEYLGVYNSYETFSDKTFADMSTIYTYQIEYEGIDGFNTIQFCAETKEEATKLFNNWCKTDNKMQPVPIKDIYNVYNQDDADEYRGRYGY